jgi:hypothetical protein
MYGIRAIIMHKIFLNLIQVLECRRRESSYKRNNLGLPGTDIHVSDLQK